MPFQNYDNLKDLKGVKKTTDWQKNRFSSSKCRVDFIVTSAREMILYGRIDSMKMRRSLDRTLPSDDEKNSYLMVLTNSVYHVLMFIS